MIKSCFMNCRKIGFFLFFLFLRELCPICCLRDDNNQYLREKEVAKLGGRVQLFALLARGGSHGKGKDTMTFWLRGEGQGSAHSLSLLGSQGNG